MGDPLDLTPPGPDRSTGSAVDAWRARGKELAALRRTDPELYARELSRMPQAEGAPSEYVVQDDLSQLDILSGSDQPETPSTSSVPGDAAPGPAPSYQTDANRASARGALDTKEQVRKSSSSDPAETLRKAARRKSVTFRVAAALAEHAKEAPRRSWLPDGTLEYSYRRAIYCADEMHEQPDGTLVTRLCGARWCARCNSIRTARAQSKYGPVAEAAPRGSLFMATVTIPNVQGRELRRTLDLFLDADRKVRDTLRKRGMKVSGLRKLECTWNAERDDYHPHYHFVIQGRDVAQAYVEEWLKRWPDATRSAQDVRAVKDLNEVLKYFTKLVTRLPDGSRGIVPPEPLDTIMAAMYAKRVWQPLGEWFNATRGADDEEEVPETFVQVAPKPRGEVVRWLWVVGVADWCDDSGARLAGGGDPSPALTRLLGSITMPEPIPRPPPTRATRARRALKEFTLLRDAERRDR